jgi:hypothetical protein
VNSTAIHEAGHAVAACILGRPIAAAFLGRLGGGEMLWDDLALKRAMSSRESEEAVLRDAAVVGFCGPMSERALVPGDGWESGYHGDMANILVIADLLGGDHHIEDLGARAAELTGQERFLHAVRRVARALETEKVLVASQVRNLVEGLAA